MNNSAVQQQDHKTIPGWAFLLGWWFILNNICQLINSVTRIFFVGKMNAWAGYWGETFEYLWIGEQALSSILLIALGISLLRCPRFRTTAIKIYAGLIAFDLLIIVCMDTHRSIKESIDIISLACILMYLMPGIISPAVYYWFANRVKSLVHPDVTATIVFLGLTFIASFFYPLADLSYGIVHLLKSGNVSYLFNDLENSIAALAYSFILLICTAILSRHPLAIRKIRIFFIVFVILTILVLTGNLAIQLHVRIVVLASSTTSWNVIDVLLGYMYSFTTYTIPLILVIMLAKRYWPSFLKAENNRFGLNNCPHCGYNLTGNTSGRCPECGTLNAIDCNTSNDKRPTCE